MKEEKERILQQVHHLFKCYVTSSQLKKGSRTCDLLIIDPVVMIYLMKQLLCDRLAARSEQRGRTYGRN